MAKSQDSTKQEEGSGSKELSKKVRGAFPRLPLKKVVELIDAIYDEGQGDPVRRREILEKMGRSPDSSASVVLIQAANKGYSLINGNKNSSHLSLTETGNAIINDPKSSKVVYEILFSNGYFSAVVEKYKDKPLPSDTVVTDFLIRDHKLDAQDASASWAVIKENMSDYGLLKESGNKSVVIDRDYAASIMDSNVNSDDNVVKENAIAKEKTEEPEPKKSEVDDNSKSNPTRVIKNVPQITFNIQVVLPENASPEVYESIFASMSNHLLGREE
ncbi:hypothetical protein [Mucilaginibacter sp. AK015]|uniref:hypothetical protein n=1 Tax=Mucilaginibacter sp. AK015 TaxID=2723072 RepID=UPI00160C11B5|nr:hypothetical protein [Mucilaginibacter sp. AK015]MBB5397511.1 hypothetical protein [Mucilaginibacter sp. AK015]